DVASQLEDTLTKELVHITDGKVDKASKHAAVRKFLGSQGIVMESVDRAHVKEKLENGELPEGARRVLEIKQELGRSSLAKYSALARSVCSDGRVRDILMYHGAGPGRWAGKVVQIQNLPSRGLGKVDGTEIAEALHINNPKRIFREPSVSAALSAAIRGMFLSTLGQKLVVADYSAIEARGVMWLADDKAGLKMFSDSDAGNGPEIYVQMARMLYNDDTITKEKNPSERNLGKQTILGCGYQMGVDRFLATCDGYGMDVSMDMAEKAVRFYREHFYDVTRMWTAQERAAMAAMKGQKVRCGKVVWYLNDKWLICVLPSGREMAYFRPEVRVKEGRPKLSYITVDSQTKQSVRKDMYGGLIVENICQATARDVMAWAMVRVHRAGYRVLFTVHDEIVAEHPNPDIGEFIKILTEIPPWAKGFPIEASGWIGERYKKG
ncbi:MAG: hypothetical protein EOL91_11380, partial [Actinobacteria bacterium]|nr:hypothetical protein [Actinomycetota bacterium]